ncbi:MAG: Succinate dehydrogenase hydrophobic membrane anchor protein, partial [uncultured Acetobacteraceae bacterium]
GQRIRGPHDAPLAARAGAGPRLGAVGHAPLVAPARHFCPVAAADDLVRALGRAARRRVARGNGGLDRASPQRGAAAGDDRPVLPPHRRRHAGHPRGLCESGMAPDGCDSGREDHICSAGTGLGARGSPDSGL